MANENKVTGNDQTPDSQNKQIRDGSRNPLEARSDSSLPGLERAVRDQYRIQKTRDVSLGHESLNSVRQIESMEALHRLLKDISAGLCEDDLRGRKIERSMTGSNRYMLGPELAIVAIVAIAGISKRRADLSLASMDALTDQELSKTKKARPAWDRKSNNEKERPKLLYKSPLFEKRIKDKIKLGLSDEVPEWMISLDGSSAAEAGYLFGSVLRRPTVLMTQSDTFNSLAEMHFHDRVLGWLIADLNMRKVKEIWKDNKRVIAVSNGEMIELPVWEDIVEFYQNKPKTAEPDNLITIVMKRKLDRELIEAALASVLSPAGSNITNDEKRDSERQS